MTVFEMMEADLVHAEEMFDKSVSIGGSAFPCESADFRQGEASEFEFTAGTAEVEIRVRKSAVGSWNPTKGEQLIFSGENLEIESWVQTASGLQWVLFCIADRRR